jgi:glutamate-ammonia-ligase adenylyltransferase
MELPDPRNVDWPLPPSAEGDDVQTPGEVLLNAAEAIRASLAPLGSVTTEAFIEVLARHFELSPSPEDSVSALERLLAAPNAAADFVAQALATPESFARLFVLMGHSRPINNHMLRGGWREFMELSSHDLAQTVTPEQIINKVRGRIEMGVDVLAALRLTHRDYCSRVLYQETALGYPLEQVTAGISALGDGALQVACEIARREVMQARGLTRGNFRFCVIAFGKLGARELNYASDIDLSFVCDGDPESPPEGRVYSGTELAVKIAEAMIPLIDTTTEDGNVFRVDTRLRPEGKKGRLARGLESTAQYYFSYGSTLERQALIKARACAGDLALGEELLERVSPWVWRKYLTVGEINEIQGLKRQIEQRAEAGQDTFRDLKHGFGGIRDIEFVTQFLQLLNGGRAPELRVGDTLTALMALAHHGVLKLSEVEELSQAYRFLRGVEHRLQLYEGLQTYRVPHTRAEIERVARCLGYTQKSSPAIDGVRASGQSRVTLSPARALNTDLKAHTLRVRGLLVRLFAGLFATQHAPAECELVLDPDPDQAAASILLAKYGFKDTALAFRLIRELAEETPENRLFAPRARKYLASMMPALLEFISKTPDPDFTLINFERITARLGAKTMLFELVAEDPRALEIFGSVASQSRWLTDLLCRRPGMVDEFIDSLQTFTRLDAARLHADLQGRLAATDLLEALHWQRDVELLRIGLFDASSRTPLPETLRELCVLAEALLLAALDNVLRREGDDGRHAQSLCVIVMGKLGSRALNYASDLDLVFVYDTQAFAEAERERALAFYPRAVRALIELISGSSEHGPLYALDLRLRPHGRKGAVAVSIEELERYFASEAQFWERLALTRARVIFGQGELAARVNAALERFCYTPAGNEAEQTREMRARVIKSADKSDLKRGQGGLHDVEFLVEFLQLKHGATKPALRQSGMFEALDACAEEGLLDLATHDALLDAYAFIRQVQNRMQLLDGQSHDGLPQGEEAELFARRAGYVAAGGMSASQQLAQELDYHRRNCRAAFDKYVR